ncbi:hypothetical protein AB6A40_006859 [Gnathostoma spinigerum]|uniref:Uncharacterized protein n=1 Tax=Gnathostoma spinigerum TaxID=75299 RepID=A0ABD6EJJ7_9BILA
MRPPAWELQIISLHIPASIMHGLIVTDDLDNILRYMAFVSMDQPLLYVRLDRPEGRLCKEDRKRLEKKELKFGDSIEFDEGKLDRNMVILEYERILPMFEARGDGSHFQIKTCCVFRPQAATEVGCAVQCYTEVFGVTDVEYATGRRFLPDVALDCWVSVDVNSVNRLDLSFGEYDRISENQVLVPLAPWNREDKRFVVKYDGLDDSDCFNEKSEQYPPPALHKESGIVTGERRIFCNKHMGIDCLFVALPPKYDAADFVGHHVVFDAEYIDALHVYAVTRYRLLPGVPVPTKTSYFGTELSLQTYVTWRAEDALPFGYFSSHGGEFGVVYDRHAYMAGLLFGSKCGTSNAVFVTDIGCESSVRFRISSLAEKTSSKVKKIVEEGIAPLSSVQGIIIGNRSVFASEFGNIFFVFDEYTCDWDILPIGTRICFTAEPCENLAFFHVTKWSYSGDEALQSVTTSQGHTFKTTVRMDPKWDLYISREFGVVDDPDRILETKKPKRPLEVWVREVDRNNHVHTRFIVHSVDEPPPGLFEEEKKNVAENMVPLPKLPHQESQEVSECLGRECRSLCLVRKLLNDKVIYRAIRETLDPKEWEKLLETLIVD